MKDSKEGGISNFDKHLKEVLIFVFTTLIILSFFILRNSNLKAVLANVNVQGVLSLSLCMFLVWLLDAVKFFLVCRLTNVNISMIRSFEIILASIFGSNITPYYSGLMASQIYFLSKFGEGVGTSTVISSIYIILTLIISIAFCLIFIFTPHSFITGVRGNFYIGLVIFVFVLTFFAFFFMFFPEKAKGIANKIMELLRRKPSDEKAVDRVICEFSDGLKYFLSRNKLLLTATLFVSFLAQLFTILLVPFSFFALGLHFNFREVFLTAIALQLTISVGITPGGIGIIESAFAGFFYPLTHGFTALLILLYRVASFYIPTLVGALFFFKLLREGREMRH